MPPLDNTHSPIQGFVFRMVQLLNLLLEARPILGHQGQFTMGVGSVVWDRSSLL